MQQIKPFQAAQIFFEKFSQIVRLIRLARDNLFTTANSGDCFFTLFVFFPNFLYFPHSSTLNKRQACLLAL
jgi:hypothetical protein